MSVQPAGTLLWLEREEQSPLFMQLAGGPVAEYNGETWEYMGSQVAVQTVVHTFRHRCHPSDRKARYQHIETAVKP